jgi:hypothetical protein
MGQVDHPHDAENNIESYTHKPEKYAVHDAGSYGICQKIHSSASFKGLFSSIVGARFCTGDERMHT